MLVGRGVQEGLKLRKRRCDDQPVARAHADQLHQLKQSRARPSRRASVEHAREF